MSTTRKYCFSSAIIIFIKVPFRTTYARTFLIMTIVDLKFCTVLVQKNRTLETLERHKSSYFKEMLSHGYFQTEPKIVLSFTKMLLYFSPQQFSRILTSSSIWHPFQNWIQIVHWTEPKLSTFTYINMYIIINFDIEICIPQSNRSWKEYLCFGWQFKVTFNVFLQHPIQDNLSTT